MSGLSFLTSQLQLYAEYTPDKVLYQDNFIPQNPLRI